MKPTWLEENLLIQKGYPLIAGVDEVGRGPLAGPVAAAAVILDPSADHDWYEDLDDSKVVPPRKRQQLAKLIQTHASAVNVAFVESQEIDAFGIVPATKTSMARAIAGLKVRPDHVLVDAVPLPEISIPFRAVTKGDALCRSIAAASIVAKVARDRRMRQEHRIHPAYGFSRHKGYASPEHLKKLNELGPCSIHRRSFAPVRNLLQPPADVSASTRSRGRIAEAAAAVFLESRGYRVLERGFTCRWGEIDLVAQHGETIAFVEVKSRRSSSMGTPFESITRKKQRSLVLSAQEFIQQRSLDNVAWRIDVVAARLKASNDGAYSFEHLENAVMVFLRIAVQPLTRQNGRGVD